MAVNVPHVLYILRLSMRVILPSALFEDRKDLLLCCCWICTNTCTKCHHLVAYFCGHWPSASRFNRNRKFTSRANIRSLFTFRRMPTKFRISFSYGIWIGIRLGANQFNFDTCKWLRWKAPKSFNLIKRIRFDLTE